eukprot:Gb_34072 [translate_table: standard]
MDEEREVGRDGLVLVVRKSAFGLPTACPACLSAYIYLRFAQVHFNTHYNVINPDSEDIPSFEYGDYAGFNSERGGVIELLKEEGVVDLDSKIPSHTFPDWLASKAMISSWLSDATLFELWIKPSDNIASEIYFADLPWPIGKILHWKQRRAVREWLGITSSNSHDKEAVLYQNAAAAYESLSTKLGEQSFFFENRPTSLDAIFLGHALFVLQTSTDSSVMRRELMKHDNLIRYAENLKNEFLESEGSTSIPRFPSEPASSSKAGKSRTSHGGAKYKGSKENAKKERTEEEKIFRKRAKYFLITQFVAVIVFLTLMGGSSEDDVELEDEDGMIVDD